MLNFYGSFFTLINSNNPGALYNFINKKCPVIAVLELYIMTVWTWSRIILSEQIYLIVFFSSVCTVDDGRIPFMSRKVADGICLEDVTFSPSSIRAAIRKLIPTISSGPDRFPPLLYKKLEHCIAVPLSLLFTSFMSVGCATSLDPCYSHTGI